MNRNIKNELANYTGFSFLIIFEWFSSFTQGIINQDLHLTLYYSIYGWTLCDFTLYLKNGCRHDKMFGTKFVTNLCSIVFVLEYSMLFKFFNFLHIAIIKIIKTEITIINQFLWPLNMNNLGRVHGILGAYYLPLRG